MSCLTQLLAPHSHIELGEPCQMQQNQEKRFLPDYEKLFSEMN
jgi:hypothetical protein